MPYDKRLLALAIIGSIALSVGLTLFGILVLDVPLFAGFLLLPLLPILFSRRASSGANDEEAAPARGVRGCPRCGWTPTDPADRFCPRDGERLT